jgi:hypothetical protein
MLRLNPAPITVIHAIDGAPASKTVDSKDSLIDEGNSRVWAGSTYDAFNEKGDNVPSPKNSDDKVVIGYTSQGLPFQIVVDGYYGADDNVRAALFSFINNKITPLISEYALQLHHEDPSEVTKKIIKEIYALLNGQPEFTMSIAVTYENSAGELHCAGFGIGDTGIVLQRPNRDIQQLVANTVIQSRKKEKGAENWDAGTKDGFDAYTNGSKIDRDRIIQRNSIFDVKVEAGDKLVGYTSLPKGMEAPLGEATVVPHPHERCAKDTTQRVIHYGLDTKSVKYDTKQPLFQQVKSNIDTFKEAASKNAQREAKEHKRSIRTGDDCALASVTIPTPELRNKLKLVSRIERLHTGVTEYLAWSEKNAKGWRLSHFYHGETGRIRARELLASINRARATSSEDACKDALDQAYRAYGESGVSKHSLSRYMYDALHEAGQPTVGNLSDTDFSTPKKQWSPWKSMQ